MGSLCSCMKKHSEEYDSLLDQDGKRKNPLLSAIIDTDIQLLEDPEIKGILEQEDDAIDGMDDIEIEEYVRSIEPM